MSDENRWGGNDFFHEPSEIAPQSRNAQSTEAEQNTFSPHYSHYQMHQGIPTEKKAPDSGKKKKAHSSFRKKLAGTVALAVVFGLVAGGVFQIVNRTADQYLGAVDTGTRIETTSLEDTSDTGSGTADTAEDQSDAVTQTGTVAEVAEAAMPAVVAITSVSIQEIPSYFGFGFGYGTRQYSSEGSGSGIIVGENDDELLIATNNHVVSGATTLSVCFIGNDVVNAEQETQNMSTSSASSDSSDSDGELNVEDAVSAKIKGTDEANDLAVVAVNKSDIPADTLSQIKIAQMGSSDSLKVGEQVVAIGNALGFGQSVTSGWVSALNRTIETDDSTGSGLIQTDAAINPGNSGGALLNMQGEVIGINSAKYADNAVEGMGYAIPVSKAQPILEKLMNRQTRDKVDTDNASYLGVEIADLSTEAIQMFSMPEGAFVSSVQSGSPAEDAGLQKGDIIVDFDGQSITCRSDLNSKMEYYASGEKVDITVYRADDGEYVEKTISVTLGSRSNN